MPPYSSKPRHALGKPRLSYQNVGLRTSIPSIFPTLVAVAIVIICLLSLQEPLSSIGIVSSTLFIICVFAVRLAFLEKGRFSADRLFAYGLLLRVIIVALFFTFPPTQQVVSLSFNDSVRGVIFTDEAYYILAARNANYKGLFDTLSLANHYDRTTLYFALIQQLVTSELISGRLVQALITAMAAVYTYKAIRETTPKEVHGLAWAACAFTPELIMWSTAYLKEPLIIFGVSLLLYAVTRIQMRRHSPRHIILLILGILLVCYSRPGMLLFLAPLLALPYLPRDRVGTNRIFVLLLPAFILLSIIFIRNFSSLAEEQGLDPQYFARQEKLAASGEYSYPMLGLVTALPSGLREIGYFALLMTNPVITSVWNIVSFSNFSWSTLSTAASAVTWWTLLPLWPVGIYASIKQRSNWLLIAGLVLLFWFFTSANMRFGGGIDAYRYREAILPITLLLSMQGVSYIAYKSRHKSDWKLYLYFYGATIIGLVSLRGAGIVQM